MSDFDQWLIDDPEFGVWYKTQDDDEKTLFRCIFKAGEFYATKSTKEKIEEILGFENAEIRSRIKDGGV